MISTIIFDCFGVLYRGSLALMYDLVPEEHWQELQDAAHAADHGYITKAEYQEQVAELSGRSLLEIQQLQAAQRKRDEDMIAIVRRCRSQGYKTGLLSNIDSETIYQLFSREELAELFDSVTLSSEEGIIKPAVELFERAAVKLGVNPEECVMIDDMERNVTGAELAGMKGIVFSSRAQFEAELAELLRA